MGIVFATTADLISKALKNIGVVGFGSVATAAEIADGLQSLNLLLDEWGVLRENVYIRTEENFPLVVGQSVYTIGQSTANFNTVRPIKIESAWYRDANNTDMFIDCSMQELDYDLMPLKNQTGAIGRLFYKNTIPNGTIYFDYAPSVADTLYIKSWKGFTKITDSSSPTQLAFPDGYEAALVYNLSKILCPPNKKQCPAEIAEKAITTLQAVQAAYSEAPTIVNWDTPGTGMRRASFFDLNSGR